MAQQLMQYPDGWFAVDWDLVNALVRSHAGAIAQVRHTREIVTDKWIGPDVHTIEVEWEQVRAAREGARGNEEIHRLAQQYGMKPQVQHLGRLIRETREARDEWGRMLKSSQKKTMANIETSVQKGELGLEVAKTVRDVCAGTVAVGATVLTGGTAAGLLGGAAFSSGIDSLITLQDTGDGEAAAFTFVSKFAINLIPGGKGADKVFLFILKNEAEVLQAGGQALVEGKTVEEALTKSAEQLAVQVLGAAGGRLMKTDAAKRFLNKKAYPMTLKVDYKAKSYLDHLRRTRDFTQGVAGKVGGKAVTMGVASAARVFQAPVRPRPRPIVDHATLVDERLWNLAVQGPAKSEFRPLRPWQ